MPTFTLQAKVTFNDKFIVHGFHNVEIKKSIYSLSETCKIDIPSTVFYTDQSATREKMKVKYKFSEILNRGDKVKVEIGYEEKGIRNEFEGFITDIQEGTPFIIEAEGMSYKLRELPIEPKSFNNVSVKDVLNYVLKDTGAILDKNIPELTLYNFIIQKNEQRTATLQKLKDDYFLKVFFKGNVLFVGLIGTIDFGTIKYNLGKNVINYEDLKWKQYNVNKVNLKIINTDTGGTTIHYEHGEKGGKEILLLRSNGKAFAESNKSFIQALLKNEYQTRFIASQYVGTIETFIIPYVEIGDKADIINDDYPERNGKYYITSTVINFGVYGGRRKVEFGFKLSV